jgi:non-ribosomal peptide synthetase component F
VTKRAASPGFEPFALADTENSIADRFERTALRFEQRVAVRIPSRYVTYGELDRLSNQVARLVRGVTQGAVPVGLLIDDEILLVAAILGVLKSGSFYLPLEPRHGRERLDATLRHVGATCVLTDDANRELADLLSHSGAISIHAAQSMADGPVGITVSPDAHAYVYYTSGSTNRRAWSTATGTCCTTCFATRTAFRSGRRTG